jgi:hypothetical protein
MVECQKIAGGQQNGNWNVMNLAIVKMNWVYWCVLKPLARASRLAPGLFA